MAGSTPQSGGFGPLNATTMGGVEPGVRGTSQPAPPTPPARSVIGGFGPLNATTLGGTEPGIRGGGEQSVGQLLASVNGFALALEAGDGETALYAAADRPRKGMTVLDVTMEANALASWSAKLPADRDLFRWPFADVVVGHDGRRLFHGQLLPVKGSTSDNQVEVSGHGRLFELTAGGMAFSCANCRGWEALNEFWQLVADRTDGRVRGYANRPPAGQERRVGPEGIEAEGTPLSVAKELHGRFGYAFSMDHADRAGVVESFQPGTEAREAQWQHLDDGVNIEIDPTAYHNRVVIRGAEFPAQARRYRGVAVAPDDEIEQLTNGKIIEHKPKPDDELTSDQACASVAQATLAELRGKYSVGGDVEATPVSAVPGYLYPVPEFAPAVPDAATPVYAGLQKVTHTLIGGQKTKLDFGTERGLVQAIRRANNPALAPESIQRRTGLGMGGDEDSTDAYSGVYPRPYPGPEAPPASIEAWGDAYWGAGAWGGSDGGGA